MLKREFCFWIITPGNSSQVRKLRISVWKLATLLTVSSAALAFLMYIAADYVRIHGLNLKNYALWRNTASQRNSLLGEKDDLQAKLQSFVAANAARAVIDNQIQSKLDELNRFITEVKAGSVISDGKSNQIAVARNVALDKLKPTKSKGLQELEAAIGGLERNCLDGDCGVLEQDLFVEEGAASSEKSLRAAYNPSRLFKDSQSTLSDEKAESQLVPLSESLRILRAIPLLVPVQGDLSSGFGFRWSPFERGRVKHEGIDFSAPKGTAIGSAGDGVVSAIKRNSTYGLMIDIRHTDRILTRYAHLSSALVTEGEKVLRGDLIGQVGSTGHSTGPHLHYEVLLDGRQVNPEKYLALSERLAGLMEK